MNKTRLAKYATLALGAVGGVAIIVGGGLNQPVVMLAGLSAWALVALVLAYGNRLKLHNAVALHHMQLHVGNQHSLQLQQLLSCHQQIQKQLDGLTRAAGDALHMQLRCHAGIQQTLDAMMKEVRITDDSTMLGEDGEPVGAVQRLWKTLADLPEQAESRHRQVILAHETLFSETAQNRGLLEHVEKLAQQQLADASVSLKGFQSLGDLIGTMEARIQREVESRTGSIHQRIMEVATSVDDGQRLQGVKLQDAFGHIVSINEELKGRIVEERKAVLEFFQQDANLIELTQRSLQWLKYETVQEVESLMQLQRMYPGTIQVPLLGGWAMDPAAMLSIIKFIYERRPSVIVECGSGTSSVWIAHALRSIGHGRLISLDQSPEFAAKTQGELDRLGLSEWVEVRVGELRDVELAGSSFSWYDTTVLEGIDQVDVLIVDGPPGGIQRLARYPALPLISHALSNEACIIVDDAKRKDEQKMMARWRREYPQLGKPQPMASRTRLMVWNDLQNAVGSGAGA